MTAEHTFDSLLPHGFHASILLPILVGIFILLFFTERLGWVYVGLVVPGYLSSLFAIDPTWGITIVVEAILTYVLVRLFSDVVAKTTVWSPYFGRERFFLIVLVSVFVRQNSQIWLTPLIISGVNSTFGTDFLFEDGQFGSIGTVLVPLVANMFWKINLGRGLLQVGVPVVLTYVLVALVIRPLTNLDFEVELTLDGIALAFIDTPKVYVILLTGAILAARFNVLYGWDYNGIMVPSLLALSWVEDPFTVVLTAAEVLILFAITRLLLAAPLLRTVHLEGPRQIALVFSLEFLLRLAFAAYLTEYFPELKVTDYFGFGYIITSLLTVKMLQKDTIGRVLLPTLHVSIVAFVCGSLVGWCLEQVAPKRHPEVPRSYRIAERDTETLIRPTLGPLGPLGTAAVAVVRARSTTLPSHHQGRPAADLDAYAKLWRSIDAWLAGDKRRADIDSQVRALAPTPLGPDERDPGEAPKPRRTQGLTLRPLGADVHGRPAFALIEKEERFALQTGWDTAVLVPGAPGPVLLVPRPRTEPPVAEAAVVMCEAVACRAIVFAGIDSADGDRSAGDAQAHRRSSLFILARELTRAAVVELRADSDVAPGGGVLHQHHKLPPEIDPGALWPLALEDLALDWGPPPGPSQLWYSLRGSVALRVHPDTLWQILVDYAGTRPGVPGHDLRGWLSATFDRVDSAGAEQTVPSLTEVRFIERLLAARMLERRPERMAWLDYLAGVIDYRVVSLPDCTDDAGCWVLTECPVAAHAIEAENPSIGSTDAAASGRPPLPRCRSRDRRTHGLHRWGALVVRAPAPDAPDSRSPVLAVETPRPILETGSWQLGAEMWTRSRGLALVVGHDVPATHAATVLDPTGVGNVATPFQAMHIAVHRALAHRPRSFIAQVRGFATWRGVDEHLLVGMGYPVRDPERRRPAMLAELLAPGGFLGWAEGHARFIGGDAEYIFLRGKDNPQLALCSKQGAVDCALLWFSQPARQHYAEDRDGPARAHLEAAGLVMSPRSVVEYLTGGAGERALVPTPTLDPRFTALVESAEQYAVTQDIHILAELRRRAVRDPRAEVSLHWSTTTSAAYVAIAYTGEQYHHRAAVLLSDLTWQCPGARNGAAASRAALANAWSKRCRTVTAHSRPTAGRPHRGRRGSPTGDVKSR